MKKAVLVTPLLFLFLLLGLVAYFFRPNPMFQGGDDSPRGNPNGPVVVTKTKVYTTRPLTREEVTEPVLSVEFPSDATDIQFAAYHEWIALKEYVRFHAPAESCVAYAKVLLDDYNKSHRDRPLSADLEPLGDVPPANATCSEMPIGWFTPEDIRKGLKGGKAGSHQPQIWIDTEQGIFYYQYTD